MNRRAQIPTLLLFLVALILSITALFAFVSFKNDLNFQSEELNGMMEEINFNSEYTIEQTKIISKQALSSCGRCGSDAIKKRIQEAAIERKSQFFWLEQKINAFLSVDNRVFVLGQIHIITQFIVIQ